MERVIICFEPHEGDDLLPIAEDVDLDGSYLTRTKAEEIVLERYAGQAVKIIPVPEDF